MAGTSSAHQGSGFVPPQAPQNYQSPASQVGCEHWEHLHVLLVAARCPTVHTSGHFLALVVLVHLRCSKDLVCVTETPCQSQADPFASYAPPRPEPQSAAAPPDGAYQSFPTSQAPTHVL